MSRLCCPFHAHGGPWFLECSTQKEYYIDSARPTSRLESTTAVRDADPVEAPAHYTETDVEPIKAIEAWGLGFCLGNTVKYIARAGRKDPAKELEDLKKARWYLDRQIANLEGSK